MEKTIKKIEGEYKKNLPLPNFVTRNVDVHYLFYAKKTLLVNPTDSTYAKSAPVNSILISIIMFIIPTLEPKKPKKSVLYLMKDYREYVTMN